MGVSPSTTGKIANVIAASTYSDKGAAGDGAPVPSSNSTGAVIWQADNTSDIGGSGSPGSGRPRDVNAARNVNAGGSVSAPTGSFTTAAISTLSVSGNETVGGTLGVTGNETVGGTLGVTGNETVGGSLGVSGAFTGAILTPAGGTLNINGLAVITGNEAVGGGLAVTGAVTGGTSASFSSTVRGAIQDKGGAVYHVKAYGLLGDGSTDDTAALQTLVNTVNSAGGGTVLFDKGTFILHGVISMPSMTKLNFKGSGQGVTILKSTMPVGTPNAGDPTMFNFSDSSYVTITGITFDNNNIVTTNGLTQLVGALRCANLTVTECEFLNFKRWCLAFNSVTDLTVTSCYFNRTTIENSYQNLALVILSTVYRSGPCMITRNKMVGAGAEILANDTNFSENEIIGFGYGAGIAMDNGSTLVVIKGNIIRGGTGQDVNGVYCAGVECYASEAAIVGNVVHNNDGAGIVFGGKYSTITGNVSYDNGSAANAGVGIADNYQDSTYNGSFSIVSGNISRQIVGIYQQYGFGDIGPSNITSSIHFAGNDFSGNSVAPYLKAVGSTGYTIVSDTIQGSSAWTPGIFCESHSPWANGTKRSWRPWRSRTGVSIAASSNPQSPMIARLSSIQPSEVSPIASCTDRIKWSTIAGVSASASTGDRSVLRYSNSSAAPASSISRRSPSHLRRAASSSASSSLVSSTFSSP